MNLNVMLLIQMRRRAEILGWHIMPIRLMWQSRSPKSAGGETLFLKQFFIIKLNDDVTSSGITIKLLLRRTLQRSDY
jgi:hypothetical protein